MLKHSRDISYARCLFFIFRFQREAKARLTLHSWPLRSRKIAKEVNYYSLMLLCHYALRRSNVRKWPGANKITLLKLFTTYHTYPTCE